MSAVRVTRRLVVNADDFGLSDGTNAGIVRAHQHGIVTSTTLMVRQPAASAAAELARMIPSLDVGLHTDLGEWEFRDDEWRPVYERVDLEDASAVEGEVRAQVEAFLDLLGRPPTHLDSHQHVHRRPAIERIMADVAAELAVPLRQRDVAYCGDFYGQTDEGSSLPGRVGVDGLVQVLDRLQPGLTELACHPAARVDMPGSYGPERLVELETLCDPRLPGELARRDITLCTFAGVPA